MKSVPVGRLRGRSRLLALAVVAAGAAGTVAIIGATTALAATSGPIVGIGVKVSSSGTVTYLVSYP